MSPFTLRSKHTAGKHQFFFILFKNKEERVGGHYWQKVLHTAHWHQSLRRRSSNYQIVVYQIITVTVT